jgi:hypothetical protein
MMTTDWMFHVSVLEKPKALKTATVAYPPVDFEQRPTSTAISLFHPCPPSRVRLTSVWECARRGKALTRFRTAAVWNEAGKDARRDE